ncbi:MAG: sensor histidine kinase, partial [Streptomyces sp.]
MRKQLLLLTGVTTALVLITLLVPLALLTHSHAENEAMSGATQRGQSVAAVVGSTDTSTGRGRRLIRGVLNGLDAGGRPRTSVVLPDGDVLGRHPASVSRSALRLARSGRAFTYAPDSGGRVVMVPVLGTSGAGAGPAASVVQVTVSKAQLRDGAVPSWLAVAGLGLALTLLGLAFADRMAARLVRTTRRLARAADRLAAGDLAARAEPSGPGELQLLAVRLNELGERIGVLVGAERERTADLAHRLRTPVAALRLEAEGLRGEEAAGRIEAGVLALERSVDEVIRTARREAAAPGSERSDLAAVARERTAFWTPLAEDQGRGTAIAAPPEPVPVRVSAEDLCAVLDALIGNVLDHTPEGTAVRVTVTADGSLTVDDDGPGFPPGAAVAARGESGAGSTGLGLD